MGYIGDDTSLKRKPGSLLWKSLVKRCKDLRAVFLGRPCFFLVCSPSGLHNLLKLLVQSFFRLLAADLYAAHISRPSQPHVLFLTTRFLRLTSFLAHFLTLVLRLFNNLQSTTEAYATCKCWKLSSYWPFPFTSTTLIYRKYVTAKQKKWGGGWHPL